MVWVLRSWRAALGGALVALLAACSDRAAFDLTPVMADGRSANATGLLRLEK
ncbi:MAG: hypothetical protein OXT09_25710 [Myxococcales bacterium]|nr:hypothetical protein [Myxococcales bacterium]